MTKEKAIQKAILGGYEFEVKNGSPGGGFKVRRDGVWAFDTEGNGLFTAIEKVYMDRDFWRCLGKSVGWRPEVMWGHFATIEEWQYQWHRFIDHLAAEKTAEAFFETLQ